MMKYLCISEIFKEQKTIFHGLQGHFQALSVVWTKQ